MLSVEEWRAIERILAWSREHDIALAGKLLGYVVDRCRPGVEGNLATPPEGLSDTELLDRIEGRVVALHSVGHLSFVFEPWSKQWKCFVNNECDIKQTHHGNLRDALRAATEEQE